MSSTGLVPEQESSMKITKRVRVLAAIVGSGIVVASSACGTDATAPTPAAPAARVTTSEARSPFVPTEASKALVGVADGVYSVNFNPAAGQVFTLGPNRIEIPANAVCAIGTSGYGPAFWDKPCTPETRRVTLTVTVKGASSSNPQIDFQPAMRFNPQTSVNLYFYVPGVTRDDAKNWLILYCANSLNVSSGSGSSGSCANEAKTDLSLRTYIDYSASVLFRRIKHFSVYRVDGGYVSAE
jgi:hypothetical protein